MIGLKLKELRGKKNITQAKLAEDMGVAVGTIGNWETNSREPDIQMLTRLADYFGVSIDHLLDHGANLKIPEELSEIQIAFYEGTKDLKDEDLKALIPIAAALKSKK